MYIYCVYRFKSFLFFISRYIIMSFNMNSITNALNNIVSTDEQKQNAAIDAYDTQQRLLANGAFIPDDQILKDPRIKKGGKFRRNSYKRRVSTRMNRRKSRKHRRRL